MAENLNEDIEAPDRTEDTALLTNGRSDSCRQRLLILGRLLLHLGCFGYNLYLIWLLAHLKDNPYFWFLSFIPFYFNVVPFLALTVMKVNLFAPSFSVVFMLMSCFTMLTRLGYYHRKPDEFIGPRFIIMSLQGSIVLIVLDCFVQRELKVESLLNFKDTLSRILLDFVDIFNMIEILSLNECVGVGSFVSEESPTEKAIQAFCTLSFLIVSYGSTHDLRSFYDAIIHQREAKLYYAVLDASFLFQNLPFLVIRIVIWARYSFYHLGFIVKNVIALIYFSVWKVKSAR